MNYKEEIKKAVLLAIKHVWGEHKKEKDIVNMIVMFFPNKSTQDSSKFILAITYKSGEDKYFDCNDMEVDLSELDVSENKPIFLTTKGTIIKY